MHDLPGNPRLRAYRSRSVTDSFDTQFRNDGINRLFGFMKFIGRMSQQMDQVG
ncbi:hypothetical protein [Spirosoma utsteinense]|uniref:Transposase DDE domain-containing protein n=1 Tax=Spirosoma utsteinense TaxID=2585773 RepID=A0ABR6W3N6_9BACT|nr:hypothetical protein [Spirosoma utsteinense]MBC3784751.1 hypothetical protein [Spirosoma utsteinense]MBC3791213.1 hypothetical protein [Spirosoma utsteinense]